MCPPVSNEPGRLFAIVPAAGYSRRMGRPKLLLPLGDGTVISRVLSVLQRGGVAHTVVVVRPGDDELRAEVLACGAVAVSPLHPPPTMRHSVEFALGYVAESYRPVATDGWLMSPADHPLLDERLLAGLLARWRTGECRILVPAYQGRRGHPVLFRWELAEKVKALPPDCGINELLRRNEADVRELAVADPAILQDLDTPADYARLRQGDWH